MGDNTENRVKPKESPEKDPPKDRAEDHSHGLKGSSEMMDRSALQVLKAKPASSAKLHDVELHDGEQKNKTYQIHKGDTLSDIAKRELGPKASAKEIYAMVEQMTKVNKGGDGVKSADKIIAGKTMIIPDLTIDDPRAKDSRAQTRGTADRQDKHEQTAVPNGRDPERGIKDVPPGPSRDQSAAISGAADKPAVGDKPAVSDKPTVSDKPAVSSPDGPRDTAPKPAVSGPDISSDTAPKPVPPQTDTQRSDMAKSVGVGGATEKPPVSDDAKQKALEQDALAIRKATGNDNMIARWADKDAINKILEGKSEADRKAIDSYYRQHFKVGLDQEMSKFESGSDLDKFRNILNRKDAGAENENARRIHQDLMERQNWVSGRSNDQIEKDIRDTLASHNRDQINKMADEYQKTYGTPLRDAIAKDPSLSQMTKDMAAVYLDPARKPGSSEDTAKLADVALKNHNLAAFQEAMRDASPEARKAYMDNGGEKRVNDTFSHWYSDKDLKHALDYAREGKLDAATQVRENTHLINNDKGIDQAIKTMSDDDRKMYANGRDIASGKSVDGLSAEDSQKARAYYDRMHGAMVDASNETQVKKWEDQIANKGESTFIGNLASHRGWLYNDGMDKINGDIRSMSQADWQDAKDHPERREDLKKMLGTLNKSEAEINQSLAVYDKMLSAGSYNQAKDEGKESVLSALDKNSHWYGANREGTLDAISGMSQTDQARYRSDEAFRKQVDEKVKGLDMVSDREAAGRMLEQIKAGKAPDSDPVANLDRIMNLDGSKTGDAVKAMEKAFKDDPTLLQRLHTDKEFAAKFNMAAQRAFGEDFDQFGKPYLENGRLDLQTKLSLSRGVFSDDTDQIYSDLKNASPQEKLKLVADPNYQEKVLGFLGDERKKVALAVVQQGEERPEDKIRSATIGWGGSNDIVSVLKGIKPAELESVKTEYARKYGSSLEGDLADKLGGADKLEAQRVFTQNLSAESRVNIARDQTENTRSGIGASISDNVWGSGTGAQADDSMNRTTQALKEQNQMQEALASGEAMARNLTPEQQRALQERVSAKLNEAIAGQNQATTNHMEAKAAAADYVADGAIAAVGIGSLIVTGGADAPLLLALAGAGATLKVGSKAVLEGNDYDWSISQVAKDVAVGSVTAAASVIGPGEVAAVFNIGKTASEEAAKVAVKQVAVEALAEGAEETLRSGTKEIVRNALSSGAKNLDEKEFVQLANKAVAPELTGAAREEAVMKLASSLQTQVSENMAQGVVRTFTQHGLNMAGGGVGGGAGGVVEGAADWDSRKSVAANLRNVAGHAGEGALSGAIGGGVMSVGMEGLGHGISGVRSSLARRAESQAQHIESLANAGDAIKAHTANAAVESTAGAAVEGAERVGDEAAKKAADEAAKKAADEAAKKAADETVRKTADEASKAPVVRTNETGRVNQVDGPGGTTKIEYVNDGTREGAVSKVELSNGRTYTSKDGENWTITTANGYKDSVKGKLAVDSDGNVTFNEKSGYKVEFRADGSKYEQTIDGGRKAIDGQGRLSEVYDSLNRPAKISYGDDGIAQIRRSTGDTLERSTTSKDGWVLKSAEHPEGIPIEGKGTAQPDGSVRIVKENGSTEVYRPDGSRQEYNEKNQYMGGTNAKGERTEVNYDADGQMERITLPDGYVAQRMPLIEKDAEGRIIGITRPFQFNDIKIKYENEGGQLKQTFDFQGTQYSSTDGHNWSKVNQSGETGQWKGSISVDENANVTLRSEDGSMTRIHRRDGVKLEYTGEELTGVKDSVRAYTRSPDGGWDGVATNSEPQHFEGDFKVTDKGVMYHDPSGEIRHVEEKQPWSWGKNGSHSDLYRPVQIDEKGNITVPNDYISDRIYHTDGSETYRDLKSGEILGKRLADGSMAKLANKDGVPRDSFHEQVNDNFHKLQDITTQNAAVDQVKKDMADVFAVGADGKETSVIKSLQEDPNLSERQKANILRNLAEVREHYAAYRTGDRMHSESEINWIHTQGELGRVLQSSRANGLSANETEEALLASMYSDSVKFSFPPPKDMNANFFTHHLDGAIEARVKLTEQGFPPERIDAVVQAIHEHQIAPPKFMGVLYYGRIDSELKNLETQGVITAEKAAEMSATLKAMKGSDPGMNYLDKFARVNDVPHVKGADGKWEVAFTPQEKELLKLAGIERWSVPHDPRLEANFKQLPIDEQNKLVSRFNVSRALIDGDAIDNYATVTGASKIVALRTPGSFFRDSTVWSSMESISHSFTDARSVLSPKGQEIADAALAHRNSIIYDPPNGVKGQLEDWLRSRGKDPSTSEIPFYNAELKHPELLNSADSARLNQMLADPSKHTEAEINALRYQGLSPKEIEDYKFAQEISSQMRDLLRKAGRLDHELPGRFEAASAAKPKVEWAETRPGKLELPPESARKDLGNGKWEAQTAEGRVIHDGELTKVTNDHNFERTYDKNGNLLKTIENGRERTFTYNENGELRSIKLADAPEITTEDGKTWWQAGRDGSKAEKPVHEGKIVTDPDGSVKFISKNEKQITYDRMDGSREVHLANGRVDYITADRAYEKAQLDRLAAESFPDAARLERFNKLREEFEVTATARGLSEEKQALLLKQINRLLAPEPTAVLSLADRADLAEQLLNHSTHLDSISQGNNSTCNVTTLENRNYARNPDKNAQNVADAALTGKFTTNSGKVIDMTQLDAGLKPDAQALKNLQIQRSGSGEILRDGTRDWASQIAEVGLVNSHWQTTSHYVVNGRELESYNLTYDREHKLIGALTDRKAISKVYDKEGKPLTALNEGDKAYTRWGKPIPESDYGRLVFTNSGYLKGITKEDNITHIYNQAGGRYNSGEASKAGVVGFDKDGKQIFRVTEPGDIKYDKQLAPSGAFGKERVLMREGDTWVPLKDEDSDLLSAPHIYTSELEQANRQFTGLKDSNYTVTYDNLNSPQDLKNALIKMKEAGELPAVLQVHTSKRPFSSTYGIESAWAGGGWHVVNIQDIDAATGRIKMTNQWGKAFNHMEEGVSVEKVFNGLKPNKMIQYLDEHKTLRTAYRVGFVGGVGAGLLLGEKYGIETYYDWKYNRGRFSKQNTSSPYGYDGTNSYPQQNGDGSEEYQPPVYDSGSKSNYQRRP